MKKFKRGFTLAEVLITLGIIGVVAAITIPTLIKNYQKQAWTNQLKKTVSTIEQGFQMAMAADGVMELENTSLIQSMGPGGTSQDNEAFFNEFKKYFKVVSIKQSGPSVVQGYRCLNGSSCEELSGVPDYISNLIYLADGSKLMLNLYNSTDTKNSITCNRIKALGGSLCSIIGTNYFAIDVNGDKGPNQLGRDLFWFTFLGNNGRLYPCGGKDDALYSQQTELSSNVEYWKNDNTCDTSATNSYGYGCAARIIENGWKMDY